LHHQFQAHQLITLEVVAVEQMVCQLEQAVLAVAVTAVHQTILLEEMELQTLAVAAAVVVQMAQIKTAVQAVQA
jgi:hypothetical protein